MTFYRKSSASTDWLNVLAGMSFVLFLTLWWAILFAYATGFEFGAGRNAPGWTVEVFSDIYIDRITSVAPPPLNSPLWVRGTNRWSFAGIVFQQSVASRWNNQSTRIPGQFVLHSEFWTPATWPLSLTFALPLFWFVKRYRAARQIKRLLSTGLCTSCGYDLRSSGSHCPECGLLRPAGNAAIPKFPRWAIVLLILTAAISVPLVIGFIIWVFQDF